MLGPGSGGGGSMSVLVLLKLLEVLMPSSIVSCYLSGPPMGLGNHRHCFAMVPFLPQWAVSICDKGAIEIGLVASEID